MCVLVNLLHVYNEYGRKEKVGSLYVVGGEGLNLALAIFGIAAMILDSDDEGQLPNRKKSQ